MIAQTVSTSVATRRGIVPLVAAAAWLSAGPQVSEAAIAGFGDFSGFAINQADSAAPPTVSVAGGSITLTNTGPDEARSIFATTPQSIGAFTAKFTYRATNIGFNFNNYQGAAFVVQTAPAGTAAVGTNTGFGYSGIASSLGVPIALLNQGDPVTRTTLAKNGVVPAPTTLDTLNAYNGNPIDVTISYNGTFVHEELKDTVTAGVWSADYVLSPNLTTQLGRSTAYVGFTAGTVAGVNQTISNFQFTSGVPEPTALMAVAALLPLLGRRVGGSERACAVAVGGSSRTATAVLLKGTCDRCRTYDFVADRVADAAMTGFAQMGLAIGTVAAVATTVGAGVAAAAAMAAPIALVAGVVYVLGGFNEKEYSG